MACFVYSEQDGFYLHTLGSLGEMNFCYIKIKKTEILVICLNNLTRSPSF